MNHFYKRGKFHKECMLFIPRKSLLTPTAFGAVIGNKLNMFPRTQMREVKVWRLRRRRLRTSS